MNATEHQPDPDRKAVAMIAVELIAERFANVYGARPGKEAEDAFVQWVMESEVGRQVDVAALKSDVANLCTFRAGAPDEWKRRKPWLNRPKGPKLLRVLTQITLEAKREADKLRPKAIPMPIPTPEQIADADARADAAARSVTIPPGPSSPEAVELSVPTEIKGEATVVKGTAEVTPAGVAVELDKASPAASQGDPQ